MSCRLKYVSFFWPILRSAGFGWGRQGGAAQGRNNLEPWWYFWHLRTASFLIVCQSPFAPWTIFNVKRTKGCKGMGFGWKVHDAARLSWGPLHRFHPQSAPHSPAQLNSESGHLQINQEMHKKCQPNAKKGQVNRVSRWHHFFGCSLTMQRYRQQRDSFSRCLSYLLWHLLRTHQLSLDHQVFQESLTVALQVEVDVLFH